MQYRHIQINDQHEMRIKRERSTGCLWLTFGILCTMWGVCWLFWGIDGYFDPPEDFSARGMILPGLVIGIPGVLIGLLSAGYGFKRIKYANELRDTGDKVYYGIKRLKLVWTLTITGGFLSLISLFFIVFAIYALYIIPKTPDRISVGTISLDCCFTVLLFSSLFLFFGSWFIAAGSTERVYF